MTGKGKKILISINTSWNIYNFRRNLIMNFLDHGMKVFACAPKDEFSHKLISLGIEFHDIKISQKGTNAFDDFNLLLSYKKIIKDIRPDICLFYTIKPNIYGSLAAQSENVPFINNISGLGTVFLRNRPSSYIAKLLYKRALKNSSHVFFQNQDDLNLFKETGIILHNRREVLPGSGIDVDYFKPKHVNVNNENFTFLMVSRLIFDKGIREYIKATQIVRNKFPNVNFNILGQAEEKGNLGFTKSEIIQISDENNIEWHSLKVDVRPYMSQADVIVLPSYREGMSRALLEALSMEKAILTTDVPGCRELVNKNQNGLLCKAKDANDLAQKMIELIEMPIEKVKQMGKNGRLFVKKSFAEELIFEAYNNAIADKLS
ncbi:MAG: glycosyltransferase family 4 protein [Cytophagales bacterium]